MWRWARHLNENSTDQKRLGNSCLADMSGVSLSTSVDHANKVKADALIRTDRHITINKLASKLRASHISTHNIIESLGYSKVCACLVPKLLTNENRIERVNCCTELLEISERDKIFF